MVNLLPTIWLAQSILKHKFPSVDKPLQKQAPQKGPLKHISPEAYFRNFTVLFLERILCTSSTAEVRNGVVQNPWNEYNMVTLIFCWEFILDASLFNLTGNIQWTS